VWNICESEARLRGDAELGQELSGMLEHEADDATIGQWARQHGHRLVEVLKEADGLVAIPQIALSDMHNLFARKPQP